MFTLVIFSATELVSESNGTSLEWGWPGLDFDMFQTSFGGGRTLTSKWWWGVWRKRVGRGQGERSDLVTPPFTPFPSLPVDVVSCDIICKNPWRLPIFQDSTDLDGWGFKVLCGWVWKSDKTRNRSTSRKSLKSLDMSASSQTPFFCGLSSKLCQLAFKSVVDWIVASSISWNKLTMASHLKVK